MVQASTLLRNDPAPNLSLVRELMVRATEEALNRALTENEISPDRIISIIWHPGAHMAVGEHWPMYRVIYKA